MTVPAWSRARRASLAPARVRRAGSCARAAAVVASGEMLAYTGEKIYMSAIGRIGMPGSIAPDPVQNAYAHASLDQAGNAVLGLVAALLALATVASWGARVPRWAILSGFTGIVLAAAMAAAAVLPRGLSDPGPPSWGAVAEWAWNVLAVLALIVVIASYVWRSRPTRRWWCHASRYHHGDVLVWTRVLAAYVAAALALLYGALKLSWALGGEILMRRDPLPPAARSDLLSRSSAMVAGHWVSVGLALAGLTTALYLAGHFTVRGRLQRRLLLTGAPAVAVLMVIRALAGAYADLERLSDPGSVALGRYLARWDLLVWSPAWLVFGLSFATAAALWWREQQTPH